MMRNIFGKWVGTKLGGWMSVSDELGEGFVRDSLNNQSDSQSSVVD